MDIVRIKGFAQGDYSNSTHEEIYYILEEDYNKIKNMIPREFYVPELDGKYSEVSGDINIKILDEEKQLMEKFDNDNDGDNLYYDISENVDNDTETFKDMLERCEEYIKTIDNIVEIKFNVKKSQVNEIEDIVSSIINEVPNIEENELFEDILDAFSVYKDYKYKPIECIEIVEIDGKKYLADEVDKEDVIDMGKYQTGAKIFAISEIIDEEKLKCKDEILFFIKQDFIQTGSYYSYQEYECEAPYITTKKKIIKTIWD